MGGCCDADWLARADFFYINNGLTALGISPIPSTTVSLQYRTMSDQQWNIHTHGKGHKEHAVLPD